MNLLLMKTIKLGLLLISLIIVCSELCIASNNNRVTSSSSSLSLNEDQLIDQRKSATRLKRYKRQSAELEKDRDVDGRLGEATPKKKKRDKNDGNSNNDNYDGYNMDINKQIEEQYKEIYKGPG